MTAHVLARVLLAGPDVPVYYPEGLHPVTATPVGGVRPAAVHTRDTAHGPAATFDWGRLTHPDYPTDAYAGRPSEDAVELTR